MLLLSDTMWCDRKLNLLSFGEEVEAEEQVLETVKEKKIKSSHDVLQDPRLLKAGMDLADLVRISSQLMSNSGATS